MAGAASPTVALTPSRGMVLRRSRVQVVGLLAACRLFWVSLCIGVHAARPSAQLAHVPVCGRRWQLQHMYVVIFHGQDLGQRLSATSFERLCISSGFTVCSRIPHCRQGTGDPETPNYRPGRLRSGWGGHSPVWKIFDCRKSIISPRQLRRGRRTGACYALVVQTVSPRPPQRPHRGSLPGCQLNHVSIH